MKNYFPLTLFLSFFFCNNVQSQTQFFFEVLSPGELEAVHLPGSFSHPIDWSGEVLEDIIGPLAYAPLDTGGNHFLCEIPATDFSDMFVLIDRGLCFFSQKVFNAQERGAKAVIIRNSDDEVINMSFGPLSLDINIPVILIPFSMGEPLVAALQNDVPVNVAFIFDPTLSIVNINPEVSLKVFPNPMKTESVFELLEVDFQNGKIEVYDLLGRVVRDEEFVQNRFILQRKNLHAGSYFYKIWLDEKLSASGKLQIVD